MPNTVGKIHDIVEIHGFPQEKDISVGEIIGKSVDEVIQNTDFRFRSVRVYSINDKKIDLSNQPKVNITPTGLIPLETVSRYRFNFRDRANAIVESCEFRFLF